ncbi:kunitz trypsin inhibitor 5-like [Tasmannia lanceolata]|uniref:kunitz trypsin inhibitor 5-like n=1 Tax=Tasmannia lanceolata TaxID=3420 RepID=UPI0040646F07
MATMRTNFLLHSSFLLWALAIVTPPSEAEVAPDAALDIDGRVLQSGVQYYILPVSGGHGVTLTSRNWPCPLNVAQLDLDTSDGLPLTFSPVNATEKVVQVSMDVRIMFLAATVCVQSTVWRVGDADLVTRRRYVTTGAATSASSNWFKIEREGGDYKLVFCPRVCMECNVDCGEVGVLYERGKNWLALSDVPFPVVFKRVCKL